MPATVPVNVTVQLPEARLQLAEEGVTTPVATKLTVPVGVLEAVVVSTTVTVQVEVWPARIELGLQATAVDVLSLGGVP